MHSAASLAFWALPLLTAGIAAHAHPVPSSSAWSIASPLTVRPNQSDDPFTHASFNLLWNGPYPSHDQVDLAFDFAVLPGSEPCTSNLSLNSVDLTAPVVSDSVIKSAQGSASINASGHEVSIAWSSSCLQYGSLEEPVQVLSLKIASVDGHTFNDASTAGFTLSLAESAPPKFLRLAPAYTSPVDIDESWINPPSALRLPESSPDAEEDPELQQHLQDLHFLEAEADLVRDLIAEKKKLIAARLSQVLDQKFARCEGIFCYLEETLKHAHKSASTFLHTHSPNPYASALDPEVFVLKGASRQNTMSIEASDKPESVATKLPAAPEACHCKPEDDFSGWPELPERPSTGRSSQKNRAQTSSLQIVIESFLAFTGITLLFTLLKRCCGKRKSKSTSQRRERVTINRGRKRGFWSWISRKKAERNAQRTSRTFRNIDEKRTLADEQEKVLEGRMQEEIQQLQIDEELRQLQNTRNEVDELIRAEEGRRVSAPPYSANPFLNARHMSRSSHLSTLTIPQPINIPSRQSAYGAYAQDTTQAQYSPASSADGPFSPVSRTTSLPSYRSKPPSYQGDGESSYAFSDSDEMTDGEGDQDAWTDSDDSSLPDISPRPSGETLGTHFTGETARTFI